MAYKKTYKKKTTGWQDAKMVGRTAWKHRGTAVKALKIAQKVARLVNVETKYYENNISTNMNSSGAILNISDVPTGTTDSTREGIAIKPLRLSGRLHLLMNVTAVSTAVRVIIFRGKTEKGINYGVFGSAPTDILDDDTNPYLARKNRSNRFDTKFLYDKIHNFSGNGTNNKLIDFNIRLDGHINFLETSGIDHDVDTGGLYLMTISDQAVNTPALRGQLTLTFVDN